MDKTQPLGCLLDAFERLKASIWAKVEHRYRGLAKSTAQLHTLFAPSNLWMARGQLGAVQA